MSAKHTVILGAAGQLGRDLAARLAGRITPVTRATLELTDGHAVQKVLAELRPDTIINCAAYNLVDRAENEPQIAYEVNAFAPRRLAEVCRDLGCLLVHFSTDYVFGLDSARRTPWLESDAPGPLSVYASSKLCGEYFVRAIAPRYLVVRTCGLYGRWGSGGKGGNFVETMLKLAAQGKPLRVVNDQECTPSYAADVADGVTQLLQSNVEGLIHLTNAESCTWYALARTIFDLAGVNADLAPTTTREYGSKAARPAYSVLGSTHADAVRLRPWKDALAAYLREREGP